ncbi:hypothetical protein M1Z66_000972 [Clostridium perfringens]
MNFSFLIKNNNELNENDTIETIVSRINTALKYKLIDKTTLKENDCCIVEKISNNKYLECYKLNTSSDKESKYFINIINIEENEKNKLIEIMSFDKLYTENLVVLDLLSHKFIKEEFNKLLNFEENLKVYFTLTLLNKYGDEVYDIIDDFSTKEDLISLPKNIKNNLQKIELIKILDFIEQNPLGGKEYEKYYESYLINKTDNLSNMSKILKEDIFKNLKNDLTKNKKIITGYRNILCHNRFFNCEILKEKHCKKIYDINTKLINTNEGLINDLLYNIYDNEQEKVQDNEQEKVQDNEQEKVQDNEQDGVLTLILKNNREFNLEIFIVKILAELEYVYNKENLERNNDLYIYSSEEKDLNLKFRKIHLTIDNNLYLLDIRFNSQTKNNINLNEKLLFNLNEFEVIICYDSLSKSNSLVLADKLSICENLLRKYISIFQYSEGISENGKDNIDSSLRIGYNGEIFNKIYDYNFDELIKIITSPNTSKGILKLHEELKSAIYNKDNSKIELLLNSMIEYNNDSKNIIKNWYELYKYRTRIAHAQTIFKSELPKMNHIINLVKLNIENILAEYIINVCNLKNQNKYGKNFIKIQKNIRNNNKMDLIFTKNELTYKVEDLFAFRINYIINQILQNKDEEYIYSLDVICEKIDENIIDIEKFVKSEDFEKEISRILNCSGLYNYANFRTIENEQQKLEEKIGELLFQIDEKKHL